MSVTAPNDTEEKPVCPECVAGKHGNCDSTAWSDITDRPTYCRCWVNNHEGALGGLTSS